MKKKRTFRQLQRERTLPARFLRFEMKKWLWNEKRTAKTSHNKGGWTCRIKRRWPKDIESQGAGVAIGTEKCSVHGLASGTAFNLIAITWCSRPWHRSTSPHRAKRENHHRRERAVAHPLPGVKHVNFQHIHIYVNAIFQYTETKCVNTWRTLYKMFTTQSNKSFYN